MTDLHTNKLVSDDDVRKLLDSAENLETKRFDPQPKDIVMDLYEVIGTLWDKGLTRKQMIAWLKRRGYSFKEYHISLALRRYHETRNQLIFKKPTA